MASATIEQAAITYLLAQSTLTAYVGDRIYYVNAPQTVKRPYITLENALPGNMPDTFEHLDYGQPLIEFHIVVDQDKTLQGNAICAALYDILQRNVTPALPIEYPDGALVARYSMDNVTGATLKDDFGANDGTITGATQVDGVTGLNKALSFDGTDDSVNAPSSGTRKAMSCWFKAADDGVYAAAVIAGWTDSNETALWIGNYEATLADDSLSFVSKETALTTVAMHVRNGHGAYFDGAWHHVYAQFEGASWTAVGAANGVEASAWTGVAWSPELSLFVAVAYDGTNRVMYSSDGITWTAVGAANGVVASSWKGIAWSPELNLFVAVAYSSSNGAMRSSDGINWTAVGAANGVEIGGWQSVAWSPEIGRFVAVSNQGTNRAMYSSDGVNWVPVGIAGGVQAISWRSVAWSAENYRFVAVASDGTNRVMYSQNGEGWTAVGAANGVEASAWQSVAWSSDLSLFVAVASDGTNRVMYSSDGITWTAVGAANGVVYSYWTSIVWSPSSGVFTAVALLGADRVMYSTDGINWAAIDDSNGVEFNSWRAVTWSPSANRFVAVSSDGTNRAMYSSGGLYNGIWVDNVRQSVTYTRGSLAAIATPSGTFTIGKRVSLDDSYIDADIDELAIYNRSLTDAERENAYSLSTYMDGIVIRTSWIQGPREIKSAQLDDRYDFIMEWTVEYIRP